MTFWDDPDVEWINAGDTSAPNLALGDLSERDRNLVLGFIRYDEAAGNAAPAEAFIDAAASGIAAFEQISSFDPYFKLENPEWRGWRKFLLWAAGLNVCLLRAQHPQRSEGPTFAAWAVDAFDRFQWTESQNPVLRGLCAELDAIARPVAPDRGTRQNLASQAVAYAIQRFPAPPPLFDPIEYNHLETAEAEIRSVHAVLEGVGLSGELVDVSPHGWAIAVREDERSFAVVSKSANGQRPGLICVSSGVLTNVEAPVESILLACNEFTSLGHFAACFFDEASSTVLLRACLPLPVVEIPPFARGLVGSLAVDAWFLQARLAERHIHGTAFRWTADHVRLLVQISSA